MILFCNLAFLLGCYFSGASKKWTLYYDTILYIALCNLLYNFICRDFQLWIYNADLLLNHVNTELVNSFVLLPSLVVTYLHFLPSSSSLRRKTIYYCAWVFGLSALELIWYLTGYISYEHGWNLFYSILFDFVMFFTLELHHKNVKKALVLSAATILSLIILFNVPFWK